MSRKSGPGISSVLRCRRSSVFPLMYAPYSTDVSLIGSPASFSMSTGTGGKIWLLTAPSRGPNVAEGKLLDLHDGQSTHLTNDFIYYSKQFTSWKLIFYFSTRTNESRRVKRSCAKFHVQARPFSASTTTPDRYARTLLQGAQFTSKH